MSDQLLLPRADLIEDFWGHGCPRCGAAQFCPCSNCIGKYPNETHWVWSENGEDISCGVCGHTMHIDGWMDLDFQRIGDWEAIKESRK